MRENWFLSDEPEYKVLSVTGADSESFLQGQFTQDIPHIAANKASWTASCNYQGKVASTALIFRIPNGFGLLVSASIAADEVTRLRKYVLRSKVQLSVEDKPVRFMGSSKSTLSCPALPVNKLNVYQDDCATVIRLSEEKSSFIVLGDLPHAFENMEKKTGALKHALILEGIALIDKKETLKWMPQALNLDIVDAVSFKKGCYTGQEVIARVQHIGSKKRRMYLACSNLDNPAEGEEIFAGSNSVGIVIQAYGDKFLYVIQTEHIGADLSLRGQGITKLNLPYAVSL